MSPELQKKLIDAHPELYRHELPYGIESGDGWFELLDQLSYQLETLAGDIPKGSEQYPYATQVKSKFAFLCWYGENLTEEMEATIEEASQRSKVTCETCGKPGAVVQKKRWYVVCCEEHV